MLINDQNNTNTDPAMNQSLIWRRTGAKLGYGVGGRGAFDEKWVGAGVRWAGAKILILRGRGTRKKKK